MKDGELQLKNNTPGQTTMLISISLHLLALFWAYASVYVGVARSSLWGCLLCATTAIALDFMPKLIYGEGVWWTAAPLGWVIMAFILLPIAMLLACGIAAITSMRNLRLTRKTTQK